MPIRTAVLACMLAACVDVKVPEIKPPEQEHTEENTGGFIVADDSARRAEVLGSEPDPVVPAWRGELPEQAGAAALEPAGVDGGAPELDAGPACAVADAGNEVCEGRCTGTCSGDCSGFNEQGACDGTCDGRCMGTCRVCR